MSSTTIWLSAFAATIIVSAISLIGVLVTPFDTVYFHKHIMKPLLSFAVGALAGDAFIHLIPEAMVEEEGSLSVSLTILAGIFTFFVLERHVEHLHSRFEHHDHHHHDADALGCTERGVHNADSTKHVDSLDNVGASCCVPNQTIRTIEI
jgi:zinc transporter ZupT